MNYSYQRQVVLEVLRAQPGHLTAQELFQKARRVCTHLSLGTVYRNLNTLVEAGQVARVAIPGQADRYEGNTVPHQHFFCRACQNLQDLDLPPELLDGALAACEGVQVEAYSFIATGLCAACAAKGSE